MRYDEICCERVVEGERRPCREEIGHLPTVISSDMPPYLTWCISGRSRLEPRQALVTTPRNRVETLAAGRAAVTGRVHKPLGILAHSPGREVVCSSAATNRRSRGESWSTVAPPLIPLAWPRMTLYDSFIHYSMPIYPDAHHRLLRNYRHDLTCISRCDQSTLCSAYYDRQRA